VREFFDLNKYLETRSEKTQTLHKTLKYIGLLGISIPLV